MTPARIGPPLAALLVLLMLPALAATARAQAVPVRVEQTSDGYRLLRGGKPYPVFGVGGTRDLELLASLGGNSVRTWGAEELEPRTMPDGSTSSLLDRAHELGITVAAGYWIRHPRHGADYGDAEALQRELESVVEFVRRHKDHPAVLFWVIGNEVPLGNNDDRVFVHLNNVARAVKQEDPNHPTMTALAGVWPAQAAQFRELCPDIDILGVNAYAGIFGISKAMLDQGYTGPYMVTEWGPVGHWESSTTPWGAAIEQSSASKVRSYTLAYEHAIKAQDDRCIGSYAFLWGHKQERTATWYGLFLPTGEKTPAVDALGRLWGGPEPDNHAPLVEAIRSDAARRTIAPGSEILAHVDAADPDLDTLQFEWILRRQSTDHGHGGDREAKPETLATSSTWIPAVRIPAPTEPGAYRLFVFVTDDQGGGGTANFPFRVR